MYICMITMFLTIVYMQVCMTIQSTDSVSQLLVVFLHFNVAIILLNSFDKPPSLCAYK